MLSVGNGLTQSSKHETSIAQDLPLKSATAGINLYPMAKEETACKGLKHRILSAGYKMPYSDYKA